MSVCEGCSAGCCRAFAVPVTGADILQIVRTQSLAFWDFVCRWADPKGSIAGDLVPHFHFADEPETPFAICLRHSESRLFPQASRCCFLEETLPSFASPRGESRCGIYADRPAACRAYPARLGPQTGLAILYNVPANGRGGSDPAYNLCPRPWTPADVDPIGIVRDLVVAQYEMEFLAVLAESWNQNPGAWTDFPEFLFLVYENRVQAPSAREAVKATPLPRAA